MTKTQPNTKSRWGYLTVGWSLLKSGEKWRVALLAVATFFASLVEMGGIASVVPLVGVFSDPEMLNSNPMIKTIHALLGHPSTVGLLFTLLAGMTALLITSAVLKVYIDRAAVYFGASCQSRLVKLLTQMIVRAPYLWFLQQNATALARLIYADTRSWGNSYVLGIVTLTNALITLVIMAVTVVLFAPWAGLTVLLTMVLSAVALMVPIKSRIDNFAQRQRKSEEKMMVGINQTVSGIKDVKLSSREDYFSTLVSDYFTDVSLLIARTKTLQLIPPAALLMVGQLALIGVATVLWKLDNSAAEIASQLAIIVLVASRLLPIINRLNGNYATLWSTYPFVKGVCQLHDELSALSQHDEPAKAHHKVNYDWQKLKLNNVSFCYTEESGHILRNISLTFEKNKAYGIAGPSGAGKSTLLDILLGLIPPVEGEITIDNQPMHNLDLKSWQDSIGYVSQSPFIADDTLRANIAFGIPRDDVDDVWVNECLKMACLKDLATSLQHGLDTVMGDRGMRLSGGQRQRVAIARALFNKPSIIVLDEATSALDTISEKGVQDAIDRMHGKITTITIAHRLTTLSHCDTIFVLEDGMLVEHGDYDHLSKNGSLFKKMTSHA